MGYSSGMKLSEYITSPARRREFACALGIAPAYLWQIETGWRGKRPSPQLCVRIEAATHGRVTRLDLRPDLADLWSPASDGADRDASLQVGNA